MKRQGLQESCRAKQSQSSRTQTRPASAKLEIRVPATGQVRQTNPIVPVSEMKTRIRQKNKANSEPVYRGSGSMDHVDRMRDKRATAALGLSGMNIRADTVSLLMEPLDVLDLEAAKR